MKHEQPLSSATAAPAPRADTRARRRSHAPGHAARMRFVAISLTPVMLLFFVFAFLPIGMTIYLSFFRYSPLDMTSPFIGLRNYTFAFTTDKTFQLSIGNTIRFVLIAVPLNLVLTLPIALGLNALPRFKALFRTLFFVPAIASLVAVVFVWSFMFEPGEGLINVFLRSIGLRSVSWLREPGYALVALVIVTVWQDMGYNTIVFLAGLQTIPDSLYDAAKVDGASPWQRFWHVTLPLLKRTTLFVTVLTTLSYMQVFIPMQIMTGGGPLNSTRTIVLHIYQQAFQYVKMGYASALAVVLLAILLVITLVQLRLLRTNWEY